MDLIPSSTAGVLVNKKHSHLHLLPPKSQHVYHQQHANPLAILHHHSPPILDNLPEESHEMIRETFKNYKRAKKRITDLNILNKSNDQIVLFFVGSLDSHGKIWHADCNPVDRALTYLIKKLEVGGYFLKIHVGDRNEWMDPENPWKKDSRFRISILPTLMVLNTSKILTGRKTFDIEGLMLMLQD